MKALAASLSILALTALTGCGTSRPAMEPAAQIVPQTPDYQPGFGVVIQRAPAPTPMGSASGGSASGASATARPSSPTSPLYRYTIRLDNGVVHYVDTNTNEFEPGTRVELTPDRMIRRAP